jgi:hypothetical protein
VFDPERDEEPGRSRFYLRLLAVVVISAAGCVALWPSVSGFSAGPDHDAGCLAVTDGWHAQRSGPNLDNAAFPPSPSEVQQANEFLAWRDGPGACVGPSRHRLMLTGIGLAALAALVGGVALVLRTRTNLRRPPATLAGA